MLQSHYWVDVQRKKQVLSKKHLQSHTQRSAAYSSQELEQPRNPLVHAQGNKE